MTEPLLFSPMTIRGISLRNRIVVPWDAWSPVAPSAIAHSEKWLVPRALERHEVKDLVQAWGNAARRARPVSTCSNCTARTAISCTSSCWLGTRAKRGFGTLPSTWQNGLHEAGKAS
jgi:hypothetical protein